MSTIGLAIRDTRERSSFKNIHAFASKVQLTHEGLRKIEKGERLPSLITIDRICKSLKLPEEEKRKLYHLRLQALLTREGVNTPIEGNTDYVAEKIMVTVSSYLKEFDMVFAEEDANDLRQRIATTLREASSG